jgi:hypothetical protein
MTGTALTIWIFYAMGPHIGLLPVPNSPAFTDVEQCQRALDKADPFLPGKTACWPAPWKTNDVIISPMPEGATPQGPQERLD